MSGVEALGALRGDAATSAIPVAALTAYAMKEDRARLLAAGFDAYLEKPVNVRELPGHVEALIRRDPRRRRHPAEHAALQAVLEPRGYPVSGRPSGAEALDDSRPAASTSCCSTSSCRGWTVRGVPLDPRRSCDGVPPGRDDHGLGRAGETASPGGGRRRLRHQAVRVGRAARAGAVPAADQALPRRPAPLPATRGRGPRGRGRVGLESHRREIAVLSFGLHGFDAFASSAEPEDVMRVLDDYHGAVGRADHGRAGDVGAAERRRRPGHVQRPVACADARRRRGAARLVPCATPCGSSGRVVDSAGVRAATGLWRRSGSRDDRAGSGSNGAGSTHRSGRSRRWPSGSARSASAGQVLVSQRVFAAVESFAIASDVRRIRDARADRPARAWDLVGLEAG